jgi:hypothetical protein
MFEEPVELFTSKVSVTRRASGRQPHPVVTTSVAQIKARAEIL